MLWQVFPMIIAFIGGIIVRLSKVCSFLAGRYHLRQFQSAGRNVTIGARFTAHSPDCIRVEDNVIIAQDVTLRAMRTYPWSNPPQQFQPELILKRGCFVNRFCEIVSARRVVLGEEVMLGPGCYIATHGHGYASAERPIRQQPLETPGEVTIGDGSWLGAYVIILGNVTIGRNCVVGANSVVTRSIPDHCVAVGAPARIVKRWDPQTKCWRKTEPDGAFRD